MSKNGQNATFSKAPDDLDRKIALLIVEIPAITDQEIADRLNITRQTANRRKLGSGVRAVVSELTCIPKSEVRRVVSKAFLKLEQLIDDPDPRVSLQASVQLLKMGVDLKDELKGTNGGLVGLTVDEQEIKLLEMEMEAERLRASIEISMCETGKQLISQFKKA